MLNPGHIIAALLFFALPYTVGAASLSEKFMLGTPYYFNEFDPGRKPWEPGQSLNFEEVFKNYQYYEIVFDQDGKGITVNRYLRGSREGSEKYLMLPNKSLQKK